METIQIISVISSFISICFFIQVLINIEKQKEVNTNIRRELDLHAKIIDNHTAYIMREISK